LGSSAASNNSGTDYMLYCFAEVEGFSRFGVYTGNGDAYGPMVATGFKPELVIYKPITSSTNWMIKSAAMNPFNLVETVGFANTSSVPEAGNQVDFLANGFKMRSTSANNTDGVTIVYVAFAQNPFGGESTTPSPAY
jgi:hypothetical protein